jgi:hypothetical protein
MAWVGALVVILAAGFAVKVGIDQGLWGRLSPLTRCLSIAAFGGLLLLAGEFALRRIGKPAAAGLISAGLGTLYLDAFATFRGFRPPLLDKEAAFILMGLVALGGFALTVRTRFLTIGVLSIVGGYLTPILLQGDTAHDIELLLFLTMLLGVALGLSGAMPQPFGVLRFVALAAHLLVGVGWIIANARQWQMAMFFMSLWWTMTLAQSVFAALRERNAIGNVVMTLIATAAYVTGGCWVLNVGGAASAEWMGAFTAMVAVLGGVAALQFGSGFEALRRSEVEGGLRRRAAIDLLAVALWLQTGVLIATAIALQFQGFGEAIGWMTMGLAAIEMGRRLPSRGVTIFGLIIGALATLRVATLLAMSPITVTSAIDRTLFHIAEFIVTPWAILALVNVLALHIAAHRLPRNGNWRTLRVVLISIASVMWMGVSAAQAEGLSTTGAWLLYAAALLAAHRFLAFARVSAYLQVALVVLACAAGRWLLLDALVQRMDPHWRADDSLAFLNWQMAMAVAIAGVGWWACRLLARHESLGAGGTGVSPVSISETRTGETPVPPVSTAFWQVVLIFGAVFALIAICFEIDRGVARATLAAPMHARQLLYTLAWACGSVIIAVMARTLAGGDVSGEWGISRTWLLRRFAWSVLTICAVKWIVWDAPSLIIVNRSLFNSLTPLINLQMTVGIALAAAMLLLRVIISARPAQTLGEDQAAPSLMQLPRDFAAWMPVAAGAIVLWGLTFEIDRLLTQNTPLPSALAAFPPMHLRALLWIVLWSLGGAVMFVIGWKRLRPAPFSAGITVAALSAAAWLTVGTASWRVTDPPVAVTPIVNLQFAVGAICGAILIAMAVMVRRRRDEEMERHRDEVAEVSAAPPHSVSPFLRLSVSTALSSLPTILFALVGILGLWLGSIEIDRMFDHSPMVRQAGLSVWWALYAVGLIVLGFAQRLALVRYAGLGLLSLTVVKVLFVDFANLDNLPRVLSFAVAGLLLIATSVVYARLSPKLLREE